MQRWWQCCYFVPNRSFTRGRHVRWLKRSVNKSWGAASQQCDAEWHCGRWLVFLGAKSMKAAVVRCLLVQFFLCAGEVCYRSLRSCCYCHNFLPALQSAFTKVSDRFECASVDKTCVWDLGRKENWKGQKFPNILPKNSHWNLPGFFSRCCPLLHSLSVLLIWGKNHVWNL